MSNLMIAPPPAPVNAESPKLTSAHALPADSKVTGKKVQDIKAEAQSAADEFSATLKDGLEKEAKKGESKNELAAQLLGAQAKPVLLLDPKTGKPASVVKEETPGAKVNPAPSKPVAQVSQGKETLATELAKNTNAKETHSAKLPLAAAGSEKQVAVESASPKALNLNPLQELMLNQQVQVPQKGAQAKVELAQALKAGEGSDPEFTHAFEVESLATAKKKVFSEKEVGLDKRAPSSKVSTSDFLSLRDLTKQNVVNPVGQSAAQNRLDLGTAVKNKEGKKDKLESLGGKEAFAQGAFASHLTAGAQGKTIDAIVTTGSAGKTVMTHDAIHEMTKQVNLLSQARQDGEIKIRLRPDHLGELHMSVKTQGQQVSIEIKAQNSESKKIIEESLASLKDSLSGQNLTLARIDVVSAPTHAQTAADQGTQFDMSQFRQNSGGQNSGREFDQGGGRSDPSFEEMNAPVNLSSVRRSSQSVRGGQGLDLIA